MSLKIESFLSDYDEDLQKNINTDPLGLEVIWTQFGQKIFNNKITSVALDVRSFNTPIQPISATN